MNGTARLVFWDVQHGHATYIQAPNGKHIVVDLGIGSWDDKNNQFSPLLHLKNNYGVRQLDYVIISHPHLDHIDDILNLDGLYPKVLLNPKHITNAEVLNGVRDQDKPKFEKYCEISDRYNTSVAENSPDNPKNPDNFGGMKILTFHPTTCDKANFNNHSIVTVIEYLKTKIVIPGDNEKASFDELMKSELFREAVKDSEILLAPHHGRESAFHLDFVNLVNPYLTIVSDGSICDTSANSRYHSKSRGWSVYKKSKMQSTTRYCPTTNSDGEIFVEISPSSTTQYKSILSVSIK